MFGAVVVGSPLYLALFCVCIALLLLLIYRRFKVDQDRHEKLLMVEPDLDGAIFDGDDDSDDAERGNNESEISGDNVGGFRGIAPMDSAEDRDSSNVISPTDYVEDRDVDNDDDDDDDGARQEAARAIAEFDAALSVSVPMASFPSSDAQQSSDL